MKMCPYFGNVYIEQFKRDAEDIRDHGFDTIVHPVSETNLQFHGSNIRSLIQTTKELGFTCWVDPHCVGNNFGYGNFSNLLSDENSRMRTRDRQYIRHTCPNSPPFRAFMDRFLELTHDADYIMWDEPNISRCWCVYCNGRSPMVDFLTDFVPKTSLQHSVCFWGGKIHPETNQIAHLMDDLGVSIIPEHRDNLDHTNDWFSHLKSLKGTTSVWFPGYGIERGQEPYITYSTQHARSQNITNIGTWGFRGCEGWGYAACDDPEEMWKTIGHAFRNLL